MKTSKRRLQSQSHFNGNRLVSQEFRQIKFGLDRYLRRAIALGNDIQHPSSKLKFVSKFRKFEFSLCKNFADLESIIEGDHGTLKR